MLINNMKAIRFLALFLLTAMLPTVLPCEAAWEDGLVAADGGFFSADTELFLGQKNRRRGGGGRLWGNFHYGTTTLEPKDHDYKIKPDIFGVQLGFDVIKSHGVYTTFFGNYASSDTKYGAQYGDRAEGKTDNYLIGFGQFVYLSGSHFGFTASLGYDDYKLQGKDYKSPREDVFINGKRFDGTCKGDGMQMNLFGEFGIDLILGSWAIKPFYALQYDFLYHGRIAGDGWTWQGDWNGHSLMQLFGLRINWKILDNLEIQGRMTWLHELLDNPPPFYKARFSPVQGTTTPSIFFYDGNTGRDWAWVGLGLKFELFYNVFVYLDYDLMINERQTSHFGNLGLCLGW